MNVLHRKLARPSPGQVLFGVVRRSFQSLDASPLVTDSVWPAVGAVPGGSAAAPSAPTKVTPSITAEIVAPSIASERMRRRTVDVRGVMTSPWRGLNCRVSGG